MSICHHIVFKKFVSSLFVFRNELTLQGIFLWLKKVFYFLLFLELKKLRSTLRRSYSFEYIKLI